MIFRVIPCIFGLVLDTVHWPPVFRASSSKFLLHAARACVHRSLHCLLTPVSTARGFLVSYPRVYCYTCPCLHYSLSKLLQFTLCWPSSWAVTVSSPGPAYCRTPLWAHPQIWPRFQVFAGCAPLALPPTEDFVPYNFLSPAVPPIGVNPGGLGG